MNVSTRICTYEGRTVTERSYRRNLALAANRSRSRLRTLPWCHAADRLRALALPDGDGELLARAFDHPTGAGFIAPDGLPRVPTEALTSKIGVSWIIAHRDAASSSVLWFASPGSGADVVHETLRRWPGKNLIAFVSGGRPSGLIRSPINLLRASASSN